jgi:hypothetical protein
VSRSLLVIALLFAAGCPAEDTPPPPPSGGGGGGGGGSGGGDEEDAGPGGDAGTELSGRLCAAVDLRVPLACPAVDLSGIEVAAGSASDTTGSAGTFTLAVDPSSDLVVSVSGGDVPVRSAVFSTDAWSGDDGLRAPTSDQIAWDDLVALIGGVEPDGTASIALYVEDQNGPIAGAEILPPDGSGDAPYYDDGAADEWVQGGLTSIYGAALLFAVPALGGDAELTVAVDATSYPVTVPIEADSLTFARVVLDTSGR